MSTALPIAAIFLCICLSFFFSASEMAFSSANKSRLENMERGGDKKATQTLSICNRFDDVLSSILVGNNLVNIASSSVSSYLVIALTNSDDLTWAATAIITVLVVIFGETVPKILISNNATNYALKFTSPIRFVMVIFKPITVVVVWLVNLISRPFKGEETDDEDVAVEELQSMIVAAEDEDILDEDSTELVNKAIDFMDISVSEVMTARVDMLAIDIEDDWDEIVHTVENSTFSRIPVYEGDIDHMIGILSVKHFMKARLDNREFDLRERLMEPCYAYKTTKLPNVLLMLQKQQQHLAIVTDEYGGTRGIVSLEDVMEQIVGDIWDETDTVEPQIVEIANNVWSMKGDTTVSEFCETLGIDEDDLDIDSETVGGLCMEMLEGFPPVGSHFSFEGYDIAVKEVEKRRVSRVTVRKTED